MAATMTAQDREFVWVVMSDYFLDNETDYEYGARRLKRFPIDALREIFFREVGPVCAPNLLTTAGAWAGFDAAWLKERINESLAYRKKSIVHRYLSEANIALYWPLLRRLWRQIEPTLAP